MFWSLKRHFNNNELSESMFFKTKIREKIFINFLKFFLNNLIIFVLD